MINYGTGLSLTLFKTGVLLVDDIQFPFAAHDLTIHTAFFYRCPYFHTKLFMFNYLYRNMILPLVKSYGLISTPTLSPGRIRM